MKTRIKELRARYKMRTQIKKATLKDARKISSLIRETIKKVNSNDHTEKQLKGWIQHNSVKNIKKRIKEKDAFIAIEKERIVGIVNIEKDYLGGMFIKQNKIRRGIGKKLLNYIEKYAKKKGIKKLKLNSSPYAYEFYKKYGFKPLKKFKVRNGCSFLTVTRMEKKLK